MDASTRCRGLTRLRRQFWEMCASRQPQILYSENGDSGTAYYAKEDCNDLAKWADAMLHEWDKRWIAEATDDDITQANEVLP